MDSSKSTEQTRGRLPTKCQRNATTLKMLAVKPKSQDNVLQPLQCRSILLRTKRNERSIYLCLCEWGLSLSTAISAILVSFTIKSFLNLTPSSYLKMTGSKRSSTATASLGHSLGGFAFLYGQQQNKTTSLLHFIKIGDHDVVNCNYVSQLLNLIWN